MATTVVKDTYYYFRSLPFFMSVLVYLALLRIHPEFISNINEYWIDSDPEDKFDVYGWSLYYLIIPFSIAALVRPKEHWPMIIGMFVYPIALYCSYWLWELLGWVVMGLYLMGMCGLTFLDGRYEDDKEHKVYFGFVLGVSIFYAVFRVLAGLSYSMSGWYGFADIGFIVLIGLYFVAIAVYESFRSDVAGIVYTQTVAHPSGMTLCYTLVFSIFVLIMAGFDGWDNIPLGKDRKKYNALIESAEAMQQKEFYRTAANYYMEAAALQSKNHNEEKAAVMNHKADSIESVLVRQIPNDINKIKRQKVSSPTFHSDIAKVRYSIALLEHNASKATSQATIDNYKKRLDYQSQRKR